jgi:CDP-L-myo-inositol myo-inositolphosphotransferase
MEISGDSPSSLVLLVLFANKHEAERKIAGLAAVARILSGACVLRPREAWIVFEDASALSEAAQGNMMRACGTIPVRVLNRGQLSHALAEQREGAFLLLSARHMLVSSALTEFLDSGNRLLESGGRIVAALHPSEVDFSRIEAERALAGRHVKAAPGIVPLDDERAAGRQVLLMTGKPTDGPLRRWINRPASRAMSYHLLRVRQLEPSHITALNASLAAVMFMSMVWGGERGLITGAVLFYIICLLDGVDGEMARASFRCTKRGAAFDTAVDMATNLLFILGLTINQAMNGKPHLAVVGGTAFAAYLIGVCLMTWLVRRSVGGGSFNFLKVLYRTPSGSWLSRTIRHGFTIVASRDLFSFTMPILTILGLGAVVLWSFAAIAAIWVLTILAAAPAIVGRIFPMARTPEQGHAGHFTEPRPHQP